MKLNVFVDMDGTLAKYQQVPLKTLYEPGYFRQLEPIENVVNGLETFIKEYPEVNVSVLSSILADRPNAVEEKLEWLSIYCPFLESCNKLFVPCGTNKRQLAKEGINYLLDDHSPNLIRFEDGMNNHGIKLLNGINGQGVKWQGATIDSSLEPKVFAATLYNIISTKKEG